MRNIISILFLALYFSSEAQLSTSYSMGGISLSDNYNNTFSGPILLKSEKGCLSVANGVEVYKASAARSGLFDLECDYFEESSEPIFVMFPNPAPGYTKIFSSRMLAASEKVSFLIYDSKEIGRAHV